MSSADRSQSSRWHLLVIAGMVLDAACGSNSVAVRATPTADPPRLANLRAFARLYGVIRWFHPSDAASVIDWDRFAIDGVRRVINLPDAQALRASLAEVIAPIAPTVRLAAVGEAFSGEPTLLPPISDDLELVAWEHRGYGDSAVASFYASKRRHRDQMAPAAGYPYGALWQATAATPYRGARLRLRGKLRTSSSARGQLWVRIERQNGIGFSDDMRDRPVASRTWKPAEIVGTVDRDAVRIVFGIMASGNGTTWYDDLELASQTADGRWTPIAIRDPGFEITDLFENWQPGLAKPSLTSTEGWNVTLDHDNPGSGASSLRVEPAMQLVREELFAEAPRPGETVDVDLGGGLRARVPIALYSKDGHTLGDDPAAAKQSQAGLSKSSSPGFDVVVGAADVIVAWNVLEHFWPYWDTVSVDWMAELDAALRDELDNHTIDDHVATLQRLGAAAPDGHARVTCPEATRRARPPFAVDVIEGQVVVIATADPAVARGDVILSVEGRPAAAEVADNEALTSGSPQLRRVRACSQLGAGPIGSTVELRLRHDGIERNVTVTRDDRTAEEFSHPAIERFDDGIYYLDLSRISMTDIDAIMDHLATAPGIVFDVRRRPNSTHPVLSHLLTRADDSRTWLAVPHVIRPDHVSSSILGWDTSGWEMPVSQPHIAGRVAFLTGPTAVSYAESVMGLVEYYHLGEIVGGPTAGTNGNIAEIAEPSGCSSAFTGLRVTRLDGSRFHLIGVQPTIPASRTIAGVVSGRDEVLEMALTSVRRAK